MVASVRGVSVEGRGGQISKDGKREYRAVYKVVTDDRLDGPVKVGSAFGIPSLGDAFSVGNDFDPRTVVVSKSIQQTDSPWEWTVDVTWSTDAGEEDPKENDPDQSPLDEPPEIAYGFQTRRLIVPGRHTDPNVPPGDKAWEQGIFAPNGELFDPQPEVDIAEPVLTVIRNQATIDPQAFMALANCVNKDVFYGAEPRQLKMNAPQASRKFDKTIGYYWNVTYGMAFRWETWDVQILNQGTFYFEVGIPITEAAWASTNLRKTVRDESGNPKIINLTTDGMLNTSVTPTFTRLRVFREIDFGPLGII